MQHIHTYNTSSLLFPPFSSVQFRSVPSVSMILRTKGASLGPANVRRGPVVVQVAVRRLPLRQQLQSRGRVLEGAPFERQGPDEVLLVRVVAAGVQEASRAEAGAHVRGAVAVLVEEVVVAFGEVGGGGEDGVELGGDDLLDLAVGWWWWWVGLGAEGVAEADGLFVRGWVGGREGVGS